MAYSPVRLRFRRNSLSSLSTPWRCRQLSTGTKCSDTSDVTALLKLQKQKSGVPLLSQEDTTSSQCIPCLEAASKRAPVYPLTEIAEFPLTLTHSDIADPVNPPIPSGNKHTAVLLDDATRTPAVYFFARRTQTSKPSKHRRPSLRMSRQTHVPRSLG